MLPVDNHSFRIYVAGRVSQAGDPCAPVWNAPAPDAAGSCPTGRRARLPGACGFPSRILPERGGTDFLYAIAPCRPSRPFRSRRIFTRLLRLGQR